jgi:hypothetical protein
VFSVKRPNAAAALASAGRPPPLSSSHEPWVVHHGHGEAAAGHDRAWCCGVAPLEGEKQNCPDPFYHQNNKKNTFLLKKKKKKKKNIRPVPCCTLR